MARPIGPKKVHRYSDEFKTTAVKRRDLTPALGRSSRQKSHWRVPRRVRGIESPQQVKTVNSPGSGGDEEMRTAQRTAA